jgi:hypothetical protein
MSRLPLAWKSAVIGVVLLLPLAYVAHAYVNEQGSQIDFAKKERVGLVYYRPVSRLLFDLISLRSASVAAASGTGSAAAVDSARRQVSTDVTAVDAAAAAGGALGLGSTWSAAKSQIQQQLAATSVAGGPTATFNAYDKLVTAAFGVISADENNSFLILDPQLDSYFTIDSTVNQFPAVANETAKAGDLQRAAAAEGLQQNVTQRINLAVLSGQAQTNLASAARTSRAPSAARTTRV